MTHEAKAREIVGDIFGRDYGPARGMAQRKIIEALREAEQRGMERAAEIADDMAGGFQDSQESASTETGRAFAIARRQGAESVAAAIRAAKDKL